MSTAEIVASTLGGKELPDTHMPSYTGAIRFRLGSRPEARPNEKSRITEVQR